MFFSSFFPLPPTSIKIRFNQSSAYYILLSPPHAPADYERKQRALSLPLRQRGLLKRAQQSLLLPPPSSDNRFLDFFSPPPRACAQTNRPPSLTLEVLSTFLSFLGGYIPSGTNPPCLFFLHPSSKDFPFLPLRPQRSSADRQKTSPQNGRQIPPTCFFFPSFLPLSFPSARHS